MTSLLLLLQFELTAGCTPENAQIMFVPPDTARVLLTERCGALTCWSRWVQVGEKRVGLSRVCERSSGDQLTPAAPVP